MLLGSNFQSILKTKLCRCNTNLWYFETYHFRCICRQWVSEPSKSAVVIFHHIHHHYLIDGLHKTTICSFLALPASSVDVLFFRELSFLRQKMTRQTRGAICSMALDGRGHRVLTALIMPLWYIFLPSPVQHSQGCKDYNTHNNCSVQSTTFFPRSWCWKLSLHDQLNKRLLAVVN